MSEVEAESEGSSTSALTPANDLARSTASCGSLESWRARLAPFLIAHPYSGLDVAEGSGGRRVRITQPWGDSSLALTLRGNSDETIEALNSVYLPERFIALWHRDTSRFEIIWTAFALPDVWKEVPGRSFDFRFRGCAYRCAFSDSSDRLIKIAAAFEPTAEGNSRYRNLPSFCFYALQRSGNLTGIPPVSVEKPLSFWVDGIPEWDDASILDLANHLNFYLGYYDNVSPIIEIQSPTLEAFPAQPNTRYVTGQFPAVITAREIDDTLLRFWEASRIGDTARRFLYSYRVVEYCAFAHIESGIRATVRRLLAAPNALDDIIGVTDKVTSVIMESKISDPQKFDAVIEKAVSSDTLWKEIERNLQAFASEVLFDGGYCVKNIARVGWREDDFRINGLGAFSKAVRGIRNALSHGRDMQSTSVITPTPHNFQKLQPWAALMSAAAGEVILYHDSH